MILRMIFFKGPHWKTDHHHLADEEAPTPQPDWSGMRKKSREQRRGLYL